MVNLLTKIKISVSIGNKDLKGDVKCRKCDTFQYLGPLRVIENSTIR